MEKSLELITLLKTRKNGVSRRMLENKWECSAATVLRVVRRTREEYGMAIAYDQHRNVYCCEAEKAVEIPGLWFGPKELAALIGLTHWLEILGSGILQDVLKPLEARLEKMLRQEGIRLADWRDRVRLLPMGARRVQPDVLMAAARAVLAGKRVAFDYRGVLDHKTERREVSPQTLVRYRDNWILDAYCHAHQGLRSFALSRMQDFRILPGEARAIPRKKLDRHFASAYGIFAGRARHKAVLVFKGLAARLVRDEEWHPHQKVRYLKDGEVRLEFPCGDVRELVRDVMRYADEVEVEGPEELKRAFAEMLQRAGAKMPLGGEQ